MTGIVRMTIDMSPLQDIQMKSDCPMLDPICLVPVKTATETIMVI